MKNKIINLFIIILAASALSFMAYLLGAPFLASSCFFFSFGFLAFDSYNRKQKQIDYLIDRIAEEAIMKIDFIFNDDTKTTEEKEILAEDVVEYSNLIKIFNSIFGIDEKEKDISMVVDAVLGDFLCFSIEKYVVLENKFQYYYYAEYNKNY